MKKTYLTLTILILTIDVIRAQTINTYQAEDAFLYNAKAEHEHAGFIGFGYVNFDNEQGGYIEWTVFMAEADTQSLFIRFANGSTNGRQMMLHIDSDTAIASLNFPTTGAWTAWQTDSIRVLLAHGGNKIRLTSTTNDGGPNIDKIDVTGIPGVILYDLSLSIIGKGRVESNPHGTAFGQGTEIELKAAADSGWCFLEWQGDATGTDNPLFVIMNSNKTITAVFTTAFDSSYIMENNPIGFAAVNALEQNGTIGGAEGDTTIITTEDELFQILDTRRDPHFTKNLPPRILIIEGKLIWNTKEMMDVKETYDLTILGSGSNAQIEGFGLNIFRSHNIIIRNIEFRDAPDDAINITNELSHHIWIDHCTLSDDPTIDTNGSNHDGLIDIKDGASYITVSWNHFRNHNKACLLGHSDNNGETDSGQLKTTYHHNWFDGTHSRHPRVRFAEAHIFNNFYDNSNNGMDYGIASTMEADVVVESNCFYNVPHPTRVGYADSNPGDLVELNNIYMNSGQPEVRGTAFDPTNYYAYNPDNPLHLPALLKAYCGTGKLDNFNTRVKKSASELYPVNYKLFQNFPNPFNATTVIRYTISEGSLVVLKIYDLLGREVATLVNENKPSGQYSVEINTANASSGIYVFQLHVGNHFSQRKMLLLK